MRVKISETVDVTPEQRVQLASYLDGGKPGTRQASRDEARAFIWTHGSDWAKRLWQLTGGGSTVPGPYVPSSDESNLAVASMAEPTPEPDLDLMSLL